MTKCLDKNRTNWETQELLFQSDGIKSGGGVGIAKVCKDDYFGGIRPRDGESLIKRTGKNRDIV